MMKFIEKLIEGDRITDIVINGSKIVKFCQKLPLIASIFGHLLQIHLIKPVDAQSLKGTVR